MMLLIDEEKNCNTVIVTSTVCYVARLPSKAYNTTCAVFPIIIVGMYLACTHCESTVNANQTDASSYFYF